MSLSGLDTLQPINFTYLHDKNLVINQNVFATQQGLSLNLVNALSSCKDTSIQNYSNIFLTDTIKANDFAYIPVVQQTSLSFPTYLALSAYPEITANTLYTTISSNPALSSRITFSYSLSDDLHTYFSFIDIDGVRCRISTTDNNFTKSLTVDNASLSCYFAVITPTITTSAADLFEYSLDNKGYLKLFYRVSDSFYIIRQIGDTLSAVNVLNTTSLDCDIFATTYTKQQDILFLNNFIYYTKPDVSNFAVEETRSIQDVPQNHVLFYNYESDLNFASGANVYVDFYKAKNVISDEYYINDKIPFTKNVNQRNYTTILSKQNSELYNGDLQLNYNYFTKEYLFIPDITTRFTLPDTLYPYKVLNVDDSSLVNNGSYGGQTPVFSDKLYKNLNSNTNVVNYNEANGSYLCTWLYTDTAQLTSYWVDRYYNPKLTSANVAFSGTTNQVFSFTSSVQDYINKVYPANDFTYYDLRSSLTFEPSSTYLYTRIGNKYINNVINTFETYTNLFTLYLSGSYYTTDVNSITFKDNYGSFVLSPVNNNNSFTVSLDLLTANLSSVNCNVIVGNNFDEGITLYKGGANNIYTPGFFINTSTELKFYDKNYNASFVLNLSASIGAPYKILDIINYGFDHIIKVFYYNITNDCPGFLDFSLNNQVYSKVEFTNLTGIFSNGVISKTFSGDTYVYYRYLDANNHLVKFDYINNTFISDTITSGATVYGSVVNNGTSLSYLSGFKGVVIGNYGVSKINDKIYYKNLITGEEFLTLSANKDKIYDLLEYKNNLYIQTKNTVSIYDQFKRTLGTYATNVSAVSGFKIDIINENYQPKLLSFFKNTQGNIAIAKYNLSTKDIESTSATSLSAYDQYYQEIISPTNYNSLLLSPVNFSEINTINKFSQGDVVVRADLFSGNDTLNKMVAIFKADLLPYSTQNISLAFDSVAGLLQLYNNGILLNNQVLSGVGITQFTTSSFMNNNFGVGVPYIDNKPAPKLVGYDYPSNLTINNFKVYSKSLNEDEIKFNFLANQKINAVNFDIPQGTRNNTDTAASHNRYGIPGRKNNNIKIYVKNLELSEDHKQITI